MKMAPYVALLLISLLAAVGAVLTLIPASGASYENVLRYKSLCTFAPAATLFCSFIAGASCVVRASLLKRRALYGRPVFKTIPLIVLAGILVLAILSSVWFVRIDARYPDGATSASISD